MKKFDLLKVLGITLLIVALISFIIPAGAYTSGTFASLESTTTIGLYDIFRLPVVSIVTFLQYGLGILAIGGFYGVLNKTSVYSKVVDSIATKWSKKKNLFLILTIILFSLLISLSGLTLLMFALVPFFAAILLKLGYKKITAFAATVGSILLGQIGTTFGFSVWGILKVVYNVKMTKLIVARTVLLVMVVALFILFLIKSSKEETKTIKKTKKKEEVKEEKIDIPLYEEKTSKKSSLPLIVISIATFALLLIGMYNWYYAFEVNKFGDLYNTINDFKVGNYAILAKTLGGVSELGFFTNYDFIAVLMIASLIIGWVYSLKLSDICDGFKSGMKEMLKPALYAMLSCVVFTALLNIQKDNNGNDFIFTIISKFVSEKFSLAGTVGSSIVASFAYNDFYTMAASLSGIFGTYDANTIPVIAFIFQTMFSIVMFIAPTSIFLLAGLSYLNISYKEWIKYIWKLLLIVFIVVIVIAFILTTLI